MANKRWMKISLLGRSREKKRVEKLSKLASARLSVDRSGGGSQKVGCPTKNQFFFFLLKSFIFRKGRQCALSLWRLTDLCLGTFGLSDYRSTDMAAASIGIGHLSGCGPLYIPVSVLFPLFYGSCIHTC
jgi:hypothetical protein